MVGEDRLVILKLCSTSTSTSQPLVQRMYIEVLRVYLNHSFLGGAAVYCKLLAKSGPRNEGSRVSVPWTTDGSKEGSKEARTRQRPCTNNCCETPCPRHLRTAFNNKPKQKCPTSPCMTWCLLRLAAPADVQTQHCSLRLVVEYWTKHSKHSEHNPTGAGLPVIVPPLEKRAPTHGQKKQLLKNLNLLRRGAAAWPHGGR